METYLDAKLSSDGGLFRTDFGDDGFVVWKPLPWDDYRKYREARKILGPKIDLEIEESVYDKCVVYSSFDAAPPPDLELDSERNEWIAISREHQPAGVITTIVKLIMFMSGTDDPQAVVAQLSNHRPLIANIEDQLVAFICRAFPAYKPEEIESLSWQQLLKRAAQAEMVTGIPIELVDPKEEEKKRAAAQRINIEKELELSRKNFKPSAQEIARQREEAGKERQKEARNLREQFYRNRGR